jgi:peptidyl-prolyl cis-trans isomerase B (cyclophilin B)
MRKALLALILLLAGANSGFGAAEDPKLADQQAVIETSKGQLVLELYPEIAPKHVARFRERIRKGEYEGTTFHRAIRMGIIQGGDPLSKDPANFEQYGTGGLFEMDAEISNLSHTRGTLSAVLVPGKPDSGGAQFFICVTDQPQLDGQFTIFGKVVEGMEVAEAISMMPTDDSQRLTDRVVIQHTYERERPKPEPVPFEGLSAEELAPYTALVKTNLGEFRLEFFPDTAPEHVRQFLRFAKLGLYDGTTFHRVVPNFVIQGGALSSRKEPIPQKYQALVHPLKAEFSDRPHIRGVLSMARANDPDSGMDTFFICLDTIPSLDGQYTVFGRVIQGIDTVDGIAQAPTQGEKPLMPIVIESIRVEEKQ